jgi:hypothetical protein
LIFLNTIVFFPLGSQSWETPIGQVVDGIDVLDALYKGYGDISPFNKHGPDQGKLHNLGNSYIRETFPKIDFIKNCNIVEMDAHPDEAANELVVGGGRGGGIAIEEEHKAVFRSIRRNNGKLLGNEQDYDQQYDSETAVSAILFLLAALILLYSINRAGQSLFFPSESRKQI